MINATNLNLENVKKCMKRPIAMSCVQMDSSFYVETLEGTMEGNIGDYLMIGIEGERYICKKEIFEKTYDIIH